MNPRDTSEKAAEAYWARLREMTPSERVRLGVELCEAADATQRAAIRQRFPDADEAEVTYRLAVAKFGEMLARKVYRRQ